MAHTHLQFSINKSRISKPKPLMSVTKIFQVYLKAASCWIEQLLIEAV